MSATPLIWTSYVPVYPPSREWTAVIPDSTKLGVTEHYWIYKSGGLFNLQVTKLGFNSFDICPPIVTDVSSPEVAMAAAQIDYDIRTTGLAPLPLEVLTLMSKELVQLRARVAELERARLP